MIRRLAPYATRAEASRGRLFPEPASPTRTAFQRDRDRIIHSTAFRRLKHKTQVFVAAEGDHYRTRLTHSLEVAQIARSLCRALAIDEDLGEVLALAHDLGHPPFGHAGEEALDACMKPFGGFDHNAQALHVVTSLERRYAEFDGLNLSWETLEGLVKHNGPLLGRAKPVHELITAYNAGHDLELGTHAGPEAQAAAIADDIAYNNHDIDDGLRAGLFGVDDLRPLPQIGELLTAVEQRYPGIERPRLIHETVRRSIDQMVSDVIRETSSRLARARPLDAAAIRAFREPVVAFSETMGKVNRPLRAFLYDGMYRHPAVTRETDNARHVVHNLFTRYMDDESSLPALWRVGHTGDTSRARRIADYIAGMTDQYALKEHARLFGSSTARP
jgi:dGTPase